jgi:conjugal transfer mating pair stabilization protein TraN
MIGVAPSPAAALRRVGRHAVGAVAAASYLTVLTAPAFADPMRAIADEAAAYGRTLLVDPNAMVRMSEDGTAVELFPGGDRPLTVDIEELFPGSRDAGRVVADPSAFFGDDDGLRAAATARAGALETETSAQGEAWRLVTDSRARTGVDLRNDPIANGMRAMIGSLDTLADEFTACTPTTGFAPRDIVNRVTTEQTCIRASRPSGAELVSHDLDIAVDTVDVAIAAPPRATSMQVDFVVGEARVEWVHNYTVEVCTEFGRDGSGEKCEDVPRSDSGSITAPVPALDLDRFCGPLADRTISVFNEHAEYAGIARGIGASTPPSCANALVYTAPLTGAPCYTDWRSAGTDEPDEPVEVCPTGSLALKFAITTLVQDRWWPQETVDGLRDLQAGGCDPAYDTVAGGRPGGTRCVNVGGGEICPGDAIHALIDPPPFDLLEAQVSRLATRVRADFSACTPFVPAAESCAPLEANPSCTYRTTNQVAGVGVTDVTLHEDVYDCETSRTIRSAAATGALVCPPPVRGMGDDLVTPVYETNTSFHEVAGEMAAMQFMSMDTTCGDPDDSSVDPLSCTVFEGDRRTCKVAAFGIVDCCESPGGVSLAQYLQLAFAVGELDGAIGHLDKGSPIVGAWETVAGPFDAAYDVVLESFATNINSITGIDLIQVDDFVQQGLIGTLEQALMDQTAQWTAQIFGDAAANSLFVSLADPNLPAVVGGVVDAGGVALGPQLALAASVLSYVMLAYTIYNMAILIATIVWACSEDELETAVKRDLKACHYNGTYCSDRVFGFCLERRRSYCCFASPLSRIMQEQIRDQRSMSWGSARTPDCRGFSVADLQTVDFGSLDLSEWVDILVDTGAMPDADDVTLEAMTGAGRNLAGALPAGMTRLDALDRSISRAGNIDNEAVRLEAERAIIGEMSQ